MTDGLLAELEALPHSLAEHLATYRFDRARFLELSARLSREPTDNRVRGAVEPPGPGDIHDLPEPGSAEAREAEAMGLEHLRQRRAALVVLAGGMATRMGGVVKALVEALPGKTFLDLRLAEQRSLEQRIGHPVPLWLMTSEATDAKIRQYLGGRLDGERIRVFPQRLSLRLSPEGTLFRDSSGNPSDHAPGHGDLIDALRDSGTLAHFLGNGGQTITVANLDNLGATLDPVVLGLHLRSGKPLSCEVVDKRDSDRGGIPVRHGARTVVLEEFRLPEGFDAARVRVFSTNTFHMDARVVAKVDLPWTYFTVSKTVDGRPAIQFERLLNELTDHMDTNYLRVPRSGSASRFLPVKDPAELDARRGEIEIVARARGMLE